MPCCANVRLLVGSSKISTCVPGGARGVRLKSKAPLRYASADRQEFMRAGHRRFNVISACLMRLSHKWRGGGWSQLDSPSMSWSLNVWIDLSYIRSRCRPGGTSWCVAPDSLINFFVRAEHSLLSIWRRGFRPLSLSFSYNFVTGRTIYFSARDVSGFARMVALS